MEIPNQIRIRLLLTFDKKTYYKFYWFEMKNNDFYWGSAYKGIHSDKTTIPFDKTNKISLEIPENIHQLERRSGKYSYHESGIVHYKTNLDKGAPNYRNVSTWLKKNEIKKPTRFHTIISKTLKHYNQEINNLTKGDSHAMAINFPDQVKDKRVYFEFFLSPPGSFEAPPTLLDVSGDTNDIFVHTISPELLLVIRHGVFEGFNEWHPDIEISITTDEI
jgi:hypothetical protein